MRPTPYVASLRVYEPLDSFDPGDQTRWRQIKITETTGYEEELRALKRTVRPEPLASRSDGAHIIDHDGKRYVAPWSTAARCWSALEDFKYTFPTSVVKFFIPQTIQYSISSTINSVEDKVSHILTST